MVARLISTIITVLLLNLGLNAQVFPQAKFPSKKLGHWSNSKNPIQFDLSKLPESYKFSWEYTVIFENKKGALEMSYFLEKDAQYYGSKMETPGLNVPADMTMIEDYKIYARITLLKSSMFNSGQARDVKKNILDRESKDDIEDYDFTSIDNKKINGHDCLGYILENKRYKFKMYVLPNAPVSFNHLYSSGHERKLPKGLDPNWLNKVGDGLMMEMQFIDKKKSKYNSKMTCVKLERINLIYDLSEYDFKLFDTSRPR